MAVASTNSGEYLAYWLNRHKSATVYFTYDSLSRIEEWQHAFFPAQTVGLLVVEEAYSTAGNQPQPVEQVNIEGLSGDLPARKRIPGLHGTVLCGGAVNPRL